MDSPADALANGFAALRADYQRCTNEVEATTTHLSQLLIRQGDLNAQLDEWAAALVLLGGSPA